MDEYVKRLLEPDEREAKQAVWMQDKMRDLRRELARQHDEVQRLRGQVPLHASDLFAKSYDRVDERYTGLGRRAHVIVPLGDRRRTDGTPRWYVEMSAGYANDDTFGRPIGERESAPITHAAIRGSSGVIIMPSVSNAISVYVAEHVKADAVKLR